MAILACLVCAVSAGRSANDPAGNAASSPQEPPSDAISADARIREGTLLKDEVGTFRLNGTRITFVSQDGKKRLGALENLNLERIARSVRDNPQQTQWTVSGTVTEFQGQNFLLVSRANRKTQNGKGPRAKEPSTAAGPDKET